MRRNDCEGGACRINSAKTLAQPSTSVQPGPTRGLPKKRADRDESGAIIATTANYVAARELVADVFAEGIEATVLATVRG